MKDCPFCGSSDIYIHVKPAIYDSITFVKCNLCGAQTRIFKYQSECSEVDESDYGVISAKDAWNRRSNTERKDNNMLENMTNEEIEQLLCELKEAGYHVKRVRKIDILREECESMGLYNASFSTRIRTAIYQIADILTDNYEITPQGYKSFSPAPPDINRAEYKKIIHGILEAIAPYYGNDEFKERELNEDAIKEAKS